MSLSVATLAGFPSINSAVYGARGDVNSSSAGTPTDAATYSFTNGVYTQSGTSYVAAIIDQQGVNPTRIFFSDNGTGPGSTVGSGNSVALPKLVSVTQVSANGQSIQSFPSNYSNSVSFNEFAAYSGQAGFVVVLTPAAASVDDGVYPLGFDNAILNSSYANTPGWVSQGGAYTGTTTTGYPQPQMRFFVTMNALLILASTATG